MSLRNDANQIIQAALAAAMPDAAVAKALESAHFGSGRVVLVAAGKAAWQMAKAASDALGSRIDRGVVVTKYDHSKGDIPNVRIFEAGHPVPDENSFIGTQAAIDAVTGLTEEDTVLFLLSGGGSALFEKPLITPDELSRLEFSEDKYQLLEDAITQLDAGGNLSLRDSELVGIEAAINNLLTRIRESHRQQARFVNAASHELRTPIAVIGGYADMLERWGKDDEKVLNESIAAIRTETARMKHLVEQLLFLARGDSGKTQLQLEETDAGALLREAYEESVMIDENHVYRLRESGEVLPVQADQGLLKQAVRILLDNAAKYTAKGDEIILSSGRQDGHVYLQVQDTGIGMAEADVEHMFERFYRADEARSFEGTGLGLSIAKWIVDKHGGHFEIVSREDLGTRIRIVL